MVGYDIANAEHIRFFCKAPPVFWGNMQAFQLLTQQSNPGNSFVFSPDSLKPYSNPGLSFAYG